MIFLGIDIGYDRCGICILDYVEANGTTNIVFAGSIITDKKLSIYSRLKVLGNDLQFIKDKYKPEHMCIEKLFFNRKNMTFEKVCMSKGVALFLFEECSIIEVEPKRVKSSVVGNGNADKKEIKMVLEKFLKINLDSIYDDTIDALCLALYNIDQVKMEKLQNRSLSKVSIK